ncbi:hypothetical protein [Nostoc sp. 'Peltigera malacea cyanobiont' DB3992]|uniref:hypothetical protein n=1 Tax=Nostoc sp. 'Peltigera malacea cyanobiont' DB3992 TaxID=1206980 RepID=UPI00211E97F8|nr:hypothetical protein [Nostoc sp. 'Peltigera malacea cyanobiont' DB3992]
MKLALLLAILGEGVEGKFCICAMTKQVIATFGLTQSDDFPSKIDCQTFIVDVEKQKAQK